MSLGSAGPARRGRGIGTAVLGETGGRCRSAHVAALAAIALGAVSLGPVAWSCGARAQSEGAAEQVFALRIEGGEVADDVRSLRVTQGDSVRLRWTADAPTILHLHGYNIEQEVVPGRVTEIRLEAYATGRFPIEVHGSDHSGHEAPLLFLEVYPR
jgi:hypothetical protein